MAEDMDEVDSPSFNQTLNTQDNSVNSESVNKLFTAYVLYRYHPNRPVSQSEQSSTDHSSEPSVADFLHREATVDKNFSLSLVVSSLETENEAEVRKFIAKKLSKGTVYSGPGNIGTLELSCDSEDGPELLNCYYSLLRRGLDKPTEPAAESSSNEDITASYCSNEFVVCLIAPPEAVLDLFKPELDRYSIQLLSRLDAESILIYELEDPLELLELDDKVKPFLEQWYEELASYLCSTIKRFQADVKYLIFVALLNTQLDIQCPDKQIKMEIEKFVEVCSLSELTDCKRGPERGSDRPIADRMDSSPTSPGVSSAHPRPPIHLRVDNTSYQFQNQGCTQFCADWAGALASGDVENPVFLRQVIYNYQLKVNQDMNLLKRLLTQAECDHYSLFRCYHFLKTCGNSPILLHHVEQESPDAEGTMPSSAVLKVLKEQLRHTRTR